MSGAANVPPPLINTTVPPLATDALASPYILRRRSKPPMTPIDTLAAVALPLADQQAAADGAAAAQLHDLKHENAHEFDDGGGDASSLSSLSDSDDPSVHEDDFKDDEHVASDDGLDSDDDFDWEEVPVPEPAEQEIVLDEEQPAPQNIEITIRTKPKNSAKADIKCVRAVLPCHSGTDAQ